MVCWMHQEWGRASVSTTISLWMERKSVKNSSLCHTGATRPLQGIYICQRLLFANDWLASHSYPPWGGGVGDPFINSRSKQKKITDRVTIAPLDQRDFLCFICHMQENTLGPWAENNTLGFVSCLPLKQDSSTHQTWQPPEWQVIWLCRRRLCTRRQPRSWEVSCACERALKHKQKRDLCVCVFFSPVALVKLQLWIIHSDWMKVTLWFRGTLKYPVLLHTVCVYTTSV